MRPGKLLSTLTMTAAVLIVAAVTYLLASARSSPTPEAPRAAASARDAASAKVSGAALSNEPRDAPQTSAQPEKRDHRTWMRVQSLALVFCRDPAYQIAGCDPQPYEDALTTIDPANAWAATGELRRANDARDPTQQAAAIARMARSPRIDTHRVEIEALFANAIQSVPVAPDDRAAQDALVPARRLTTGAMNAAPVDPLDAVTTACERPSQDDARDNCLAVARLLRNSSDPIIADQGFTLARQLAPPGSATAAELAREKRREDWQIAAFLRMPRTPEQNARFVRDRIPSAPLRREVLLENGVPLDPPADWPPP